MGCGASKKDQIDESPTEKQPCEADSPPAEHVQEPPAGEKPTAAPTPEVDKPEEPKEAPAEAEAPPPAEKPEEDGLPLEGTPVAGKSSGNSDGSAAAASSPLLPPSEAVLACMREAHARLLTVVAERREQGMPVHTGEDPTILFEFLGEATQIGAKHGVRNIMSIEQQYSGDEECMAEWAQLKALCKEHGLPTGS
eukprot:TRINITY_DN3576_c0_g2_i1.p2 TRINITY_DN3576_c0_g2~~TRINITY_DN3576_c0_g2_i1.p2  ORF type:complete len:195 (+),score=42.21 TRINITY_DN3576_c0_g2_i1:48-632(+)